MNNVAPALPILLTFFILACAYSAQYWAKKCHDELRAIREDLQRGRNNGA